MLGMVSGQISDAQISVSSNADRGWVAENARLLTGRTGWTGQQVKQPFRNEWIQVGSRWEALVPRGGRAEVNKRLWSLPAGGSGTGEDAERRDDPGREAPRQKRLHEEVPGGSQPGRGGLGHRQGGQQHQAQGRCPNVSVLDQESGNSSSDADSQPARKVVDMK